jgi:nitrogen-specific signal transduction histidine kinase
MKPVLSEKKLYLKFDKMTLNALPPVWADANRVKQVVYNLVGTRPNLPKPAAPRSGPAKRMA